VQLYEGRKWQIVVASDDSGGFVTSDHPICLRWCDGKDHGFLSPGFGVLGTEVTFSLSPKLALRGRFDGEQDSRVREMAIEKAALTDSWVIIRLKHTVDMAIRGLPVYDRFGRHRTTLDGLPIFRPDLAQANNGLRTAAQIRGMLVHRREIGEPGEFARMTDEELDAALIEQFKALGLPDEAVQKLLTVRAE
jgi:hypothetical protein